MENKGVKQNNDSTKVTSSRYRLYLGDNLARLKLMKTCSVDSVCTDPPYGLGVEPDSYEMLSAWLENGHYEHKGKKGFLGKEWDSFVPQPALWKEVFRVLKPGGHVLSFFSTRTQDLGVLAMRMAGFQIRDSISWIYGSGFPKSLNLQKAVNKVDAEASSEFIGWGTCLKPSHEPIVLARKPITGTVANNALIYGTGGINIDGCRVPIVGDSDLKVFEFNHNSANRSRNADGANLGAFEGGWKTVKGKKDIPLGRFPANVIHDGSEEVEAQFRLAGIKKSGKDKNPVVGKVSGFFGAKLDYSGANYGDQGSCSRFFYCAKTSQSDRNEGLNSCKDLKVGNADSGKIISLKSNVNTSSGKSRNPKVLTKNNHPTVKPTELMRYLVRLITPVNGIILDPFMGSGSTGKAAMLENFRFIGMENDEGYFEIAKNRISHQLSKVPAPLLERLKHMSKIGI